VSYKNIPTQSYLQRPVWQVPATGATASEDMQPSGQDEADDVNTSQEGGGSGAIGSTSAPDQFVWPDDTNILFPPGSNKITLMSQRPMVRLVIQDAMEHVRAELLFNYAFPDPAVALANIKDSLLISASRYPGASSIYRRLVFDEQYMATITPLVSFLILWTTVLMLFTAACTDFAFPKRSQRTVQRYCLDRILGRRLSGSNQIKCFEATLEI
jgi:hypothetical protein